MIMQKLDPKAILRPGNKEKQKKKANCANFPF